ncbi:Macrophage migration inhibitory factor (MIF) [Sulfidibacter corallicola]|uniref:L-dopachrome isomerase n=1 Tax=Sulfidibacter corallicola TaxID=2818388 RepID=A0A8A4TV22_SULCO|nr:phenylpyruvate tautomerase MIF-related protein [Sulfidibacter corallicola]QTD53333.1 hypothetical protein J3U87_12835 [Sulfidibacter corallicola]
MPTLRITTQVQLPEQTRIEALQGASALLADWLGKPESYVMTIWVEAGEMTFSGEPGPAAYLELLSLGLEPEQTPRLSRDLALFCAESLGIPPERVYIAFSSPAREMFAWNGRTFAR